MHWLLRRPAAVAYPNPSSFAWDSVPCFRRHLSPLQMTFGALAGFGSAGISAQPGEIDDVVYGT